LELSILLLPPAPAGTLVGMAKMRFGQIKTRIATMHYAQDAGR
jgi:hypothetical protein